MTKIMKYYEGVGSELPPLLVVGPKGVGKTVWMRKLSWTNPTLTMVDIYGPASKFSAWKVPQNDPDGCESVMMAKRGEFLNGHVYGSNYIPKGYKGNMLKMDYIENV